MYSAAIFVMVFVAAVSQPAPSVVYSLSPKPSEQGQLSASCPPTVVASDSAFLCYRVQGGDDVAQYVNPSTGSVGVATTVPARNSFVYPPIPLSKLTAIAYSTSPASSFYVMFSAVSSSLQFVDRRGSSAQVAYANDLKMSFVPIGAQGGFDSIQAFRVTPTTNAESAAWVRNFTTSPQYPFSTQLSSPIYYRGLLIGNSGVTFFALNASTGATVLQVNNPCNWSITVPGIPQLRVVTYGSDSNGPLDAFLLFLNTTTVQGNPRASFCRVSHNSGRAKWLTNYDNADVGVLDVTGGDGVVLVTGWVSSPGSPATLMTWSMNAVTGTHWASIVRSPQDQFSFPAALPQAVSGCNQTVVLQVAGQLTAFCTQNFNAPVWTSNYSCNHRATIHPQSNSIACVSRGASVHLLDSDGNLLWINNQIQATFAAQIVGDIVWVVDLAATLWGLSIQPSSTPLPPPFQPDPPVGDGGLSGGQVAGVVFGVFIGGAVVGGAIVAYLRLSRRRGAIRLEDADAPNVDGYGGIA